MRAGESVCCAGRLAAVLLAVLGAAAVPAEAETPNTYVAFGDSITAGVGDSREPDEGYPTRLEALLRPTNPNATVRNRGLGGERTPEGLTRLDEVLAEGGDVLLLMEGTNDVSRSLSLETTRFNLGQMALKAEARGLSVVHATTIPRSPRSTIDPENFVNQDLNERIRDLAGNRSRRLADPFEVFPRQANYFATLYSAAGDDFVGHPNGAGYDLLARMFFEVLNGTDTVAPVTGLLVPKNGDRGVGPNQPITVHVWDFGAGIDLSVTRLLINGADSGTLPSGDTRHAILAVTPAAPLFGVVRLGLRSRDTANPVNTVDREISRYVIAGTQFLDGDFDKDGRVDGADLIEIGRAFGARLGDDRFRFLYDLNDDTVIDGGDLALMAANFGRSLG